MPFTVKKPGGFVFWSHSWRATCLGKLLVVALAAQVVGCQRESPSSENSRAGLVCIDLSPYCTASLTDSLNSPASVKENNLASLPKGRQVLAGVPFEVGGVVQLSGSKNLEWGRTEFPEAVKNIKLGQKAKRFHLLHGAGGVYDKDGAIIARLVIHYADSSVRELDIKTGEHVRDWWGDPAQRVTAPNSELAWHGTNPATLKYGGANPGSLRIYKTTFVNPEPGLMVKSLDYLSTMQNSAPFLIGLTLEE
jgi:hypothetical protein